MLWYSAVCILYVCVCAVPCSLYDIQLAFVLDSSNKPYLPDSWQAMLQFVNLTIASFSVSRSQVGISVVQFSDSARVVVPLSSGYIYNRRELQQLVLNLPFWGGTSNLAGALDTVRTVALSSDVIRPGTALVAVVLTDHLAWDSALSQAVNQLHQAGITVVGVGIAAIPGELDPEDMWPLTSNNRSWVIANYTELSVTVINQVVYGACIPVPLAALPRKSVHHSVLL